VGIAVEPAWYAAVRLAQADLGDLPIEWVADSTRNVQMADSAIDYAVWLAEQGVAAVVGHSGSRGSVAAGTVYRQRGIVQIAPLATAHQLDVKSEGGSTFALVPNDSTEGAFIGAFVDTVLRARSVALLYHQDEFGLGIRSGVVAELMRRGVGIVDERYFAPEGAPGPPVDVAVLLAAALRTKPDAIVLGARIGETRDVAAYLRQHRIHLPVVCSDGSYVLPPQKQARDLSDLDGFYIVRFWSPERNSASMAFARRFAARYGYPPDQAEAMTYDAIMLVGAAVRDGARSADDFGEILEDYGEELPAPRGLAVDGYAFVRGRPRRAVAEVGIVRGGVLRRLTGGRSVP
jgi:branched-chain amino acid transport system substrate-binding protein